MKEKAILIDKDCHVVRNITKYKSFIGICKRDSIDLKRFLKAKLKKYYPEVIDEQGFLYARAIDTPVLLTAHMDTVHKERIKEFSQITTKEGNHILTSPQGIGGDDRCGIYMILQILKKTKYRPAILFCEDEEIGGVGSDLFCRTEYIKELSNLKFFIELDRANEKDLVYYDDANTDFHQWCEKVTGYKENWGSFSDISNLCPDAGISGVNISCGYYNQHTLTEYVIMEHMFNSIEKVKAMLKASESVEPFNYVSYFNNNYFDNAYNLYDYYGYGNYFGRSEKKTTGYKLLYVIYWDHITNKPKEITIEGTSKADCWSDFFLKHPTVCFADVQEYTFDEI